MMETDSKLSDHDGNGQQVVIDFENNENGIIEIDISHLSNEQKSALKIVLLTLIIESLVMAGIKFILDLFKIFLRDASTLITGYVADYFATLTPYFFVLVFFLLMYQAYLIIVNDNKLIKDFSETFEILLFGLLGVITLVVIFGAVNTPTYAELSIFIFAILLLVTLYFFPAYYFNSQMISKLKESNTSES